MSKFFSFFFASSCAHYVSLFSLVDFLINDFRLGAQTKEEISRALLLRYMPRTKENYKFPNVHQSAGIHFRAGKNWVFRIFFCRRTLSIFFCHFRHTSFVVSLALLLLGLWSMAMLYANACVLRNVVNDEPTRPQI